MKINEFIEAMGKVKVIKAEQKQEYVKNILNVKSYLGIKNKKQLVQDIVDECILYEDGIFKFNEIDKYICFTMRTIAAYTNIELSDDIEDDYDMLCESQLLNLVIEAFHGEYENVKVLLQMECDYILYNNTVEAQVGKFVDGTLNKIGDLVSVITYKINKFNINDLPINKETLNMLMSFINSQNK